MGVGQLLGARLRQLMGSALSFCFLLQLVRFILAATSELMLAEALGFSLIVFPEINNLFLQLVLCEIAFLSP